MKRQHSFAPLPPIEPQPDAPRTAFFYEHEIGQYIKVVVLGEIDETILETLEAFTARQKMRHQLGAEMRALSETAPRINSASSSGERELASDPSLCAEQLPLASDERVKP